MGCVQSNKNREIQTIKMTILLTSKKIDISNDKHIHIVNMIKIAELSNEDIADIFLFCVELKDGCDIMLTLLDEYPNLKTFVSKNGKHLFSSLWDRFMMYKYFYQLHPNNIDFDTIDHNMQMLISNIDWTNENCEKMYSESCDLEYMYDAMNQI